MHAETSISCRVLREREHVTVIDCSASHSIHTRRTLTHVLACLSVRDEPRLSPRLSRRRLSVQSETRMTCCRPALHRTPEFLTKSQEHRFFHISSRTVHPRASPTSFPHDRRRGTCGIEDRLSKALRTREELWKQNRTLCSIGIRRCCQESTDWTG